MSHLLEKIRSINQEAARVLEKADLCTDSCIQSLTRGDLHDLLPGPEKFKLRKDIFEIIQEQKPVHVLISKLKASIEHEPLRAALTSNGVWFDYLWTLKDMKTQMNNIQGFLDAHIDLLEEFSKHQPDKERDKAPLPGPSTSDTRDHAEYYSYRSGGHSQEAQGSPITVSSPQYSLEVKYHVVVSGKTFGADDQLMQKVLKSHGIQDQVQFVQSSEDHQVTILFCPVTSRIGSDVDAAMSDVKDGKPVILVLMHHTHEPRYTSLVRTWTHYPKIVFHVNVFFHETMPGLLTCEQNDLAVSNIQEKLRDYSTPSPRRTSANALGVDGGSGRTGSMTNQYTNRPFTSYLPTFPWSRGNE